MTYAVLIVAAAISIYALLCVVRIILTWIPGGSYTGFGRFLSALCDPYLNLFRRGWLRLGTIDFSPLVALAVLTLASILFQTLGGGTRVTLAAILILVIELPRRICYNRPKSLEGMQMKRALALLLVFIITVSACSCGKSGNTAPVRGKQGHRGRRTGHQGARSR